jgi:sugar phosphate isomerase/epimerase
MYCEVLHRLGITGTCREAGVSITELSTHLQGQLVAVHPAYDELFDGFVPASRRWRPQARHHARIRMFHVEDAEYRPNGRTGVCGAYLPWMERAGRFPSLGDGQIDFTAIFSKFAQYDFPGMGGRRVGSACSSIPRTGRAKGPVRPRAHHPNDRPRIR